MARFAYIGCNRIKPKFSYSLEIDAIHPEMSDSSNSKCLEIQYTSKKKAILAARKLGCIPWDIDSQDGEICRYF